MSNTYQYKRLEGHDSFRLLKISAKRSLFRRRPKYRFSLVHTRLVDAPRYETLSYVWGTTEQDAPLTLMDGASLRITSTLDVILPRIAHHCNTEYIWIDQICIDQHNLEERGQQVSIMGNIYSNCTQVIVWLEVQYEIDPDLRSVLETANRSLATTMLSPDLTQLQAHWIKTDLSQEDISSDLHWILRSAWFSRAWVFQEVVLAPISKAIISWPSASEESVTSLYKFYWIVKTFLDSPDAVKSGEDVSWLRKQGYILDEMYIQWSQRHLVEEATDGISFVRMLSAVTSRAQTSLELDQLYAFFGLNRQPSIVLQPDYKLTFEQALTATVIAIIRGTRRLDILEVVPHRAFFHMVRNGIPRSFPSWVPDFRGRESVVPFRPTSAVAKTDVAQNSSPQAGIGITYPWTGSCDIMTLRVHGKKVDTIADGIYMYYHFMDPTPRGNGTKLMVESIFMGLNSTLDHHPNLVSWTDQRILCALKAGGWCDDTSYAPHSGSQDKTDIEHENSDWIRSAMDQNSRDMAEFRSIKRIMRFRSLYTTQQGLFATGTFLEKDDIVCILHGCSHPVALRPAEEDPGKYSVLGTCYLEGWMDPWANGKIYWAIDEADEFLIV